MPELAYTCPCGTTHAASIWAAAHWQEPMVHTCPACARKNYLHRGSVYHSVEPGKPRPGSKGRPYKEANL